MKLRLFALILIMFGASAVHAGNFKVDGCLGCDGESYDTTVGVEFTFDSGAPGLGSISYGSDASYDYIYIKLSEEYVNNVYAAGYDAKKASVEGYKDRPFKKLVKSDALGGDGTPLLLRHVNGVDSISLVVDLISECRNDSSCNNGAGWDSAGVDENFRGGDGEIVADTTGGQLASAIMGVESSMSYNIGKIGASFDETKASADYENNGSWLNYVGYEFKFTKDLVGAVEELGAHASPALRELDGTCIAGEPGCGAGPCVAGTPGCGSTGVSEPGTLALFSSALLLAALGRRRRLPKVCDSRPTR